MARKIPARKKATPERAPRSPQAVLRMRIRKVQRMLLEGRTRTFILEHAARHWDLSTRQTDEYIHQATAQIDEANENSSERNLALITANLWQVYRDNLSWKPGVARQALMDIAKLRGLTSEELTIHLKRPFKDASDDELAAALGGP